MLQRQTQTASFWCDQFEVTSDDLEFLYNLLLDSQAPRALSELAIASIQEYLRKENAKIESELGKGAVYLPQNEYEIGQTLVFPALDFVTGEVTDARMGHNPEHGDFKVIVVTMGDSEQLREFASQLQSPHRLNQSNGTNLLNDDSLLSAEEIYSLYREEIEESMLFGLEESVRSEDFVAVNGQWLLADMLADVHMGHLNIAEAMIEIQAKPLTTTQLLAEVDLDQNVAEPMRILSLNYALTEDDRFDQVGTGTDTFWFLKRLEPAEALNIPMLLRPTQPTYNRALLSVELLQIEWELDDEWGESNLSSEVPTVVPSTSLILTYPHWRCGTLPLNGRTRNFFPAGTKGRSTVTLIDGRWGSHFTGWVVHEGRYVTGLASWLQDHSLPVGAHITLERTNNPSEIVVDYRTRRAKREWARMASADLENLRLNLEMNKIQVACEYDEHLIVAENESAPIDELRMKLIHNRVELTQIVEQIMPELTRLNPQGTVHVKTVYSAVNILRRCPPGPIFYALISNRRFQDVGSGFFALA